MLETGGVPNLHTLLKQRRMHWLGHVVRMEDGRIPKDLLYGELAQGTRSTGRPQLRFKDVCKRDLKDLNIDLRTWETSASDRSTWRQLTRRALSRFEDSVRQRNEENPDDRAARDRLHLQQLWEKMSISHRSAQPYPPLLQDLPKHQPIALRD